MDYFNPLIHQSLIQYFGGTRGRSLKSKKLLDVPPGKAKGVLQ
jgi:hypothetical protein